MKVYNLESPRTENAVANQFVIRHDNKTYFQSYDSLIAEYDRNKTPSLTLGRHWDYSVTTMKYLNVFLNEEVNEYRCRGKKEIQKAINEGMILYDPEMK